MLPQRIQEAFNRHLNAELYSAYLYLSMSAHFESASLEGMAHWMRIQAQEEMLHVIKFFDFINQRSGRVILAPVQGPPTAFASAVEVFEAARQHEATVSGLIHELVDLAAREKDHAAHAFLQWFVTEQVEEEATVEAIVDKLKLAGDNAGVLFMIDQDLGRRVLPPASPA